MKKAIVLLLALVVVGAFAFAQDAAAAPAKPYTLTADATGGWFYNLTSGNSGFANSYDLSFKYTLLDTSATTKGEEGTYGQIDVTHLTIRTVETTATGEQAGTYAWTLGDYADNGLTIGAKIVSGALSVGLYGAPSADYTNAVYVPLFSASDGYTNGSALEPLMSGDAGLTVGYSLGDMGSVTLSAVSKAKPAAVVAVDAKYDFKTAAVAVTVPAKNVTFYTSVNGNVGVPYADGAIIAAGTSYFLYTVPVAKAAAGNNTYVAGLDLSLTPVKDVLAINLGGWYDLDAAAAVFTGKVAVTAGALSANVAVDGTYATDVAFDASADVTFSMNEKKDSIVLDAYYTESMDTKGVAGEKLGHQGDFGLKFVDALGFVPGLSFSVGAFGQDLMVSASSSQFSVATSASYSIGDTKIKPYAAFDYDMTGAANYIDAGIEYDGIANTVVKADFAIGGTANDNNVALTSHGTDAVITISAKVTL
jgi:hypothetical protein